MNHHDGAGAEAPRAVEIFLEVCDLPGGDRAERVRVLAGDDDDLRADVLHLLSHDVDDGFLETTARLDEPAAPAGAEHAVGLGRYRLEGVIGAGGMGIVHRGRQLEPVERDVAIKILHLDRLADQSPAIRADVARRFDDERRTLARMNHEGIARIFDGGATDDGRPYLVMELVDGRPVTTVCDELGLDVAARLEVFRRIGEAVRHAHQKGVIHRDLKPTNVLATVEDGAVRIKVIDFGIAKPFEGADAAPSALTQAGMIGTPSTMAPEQAGGDPEESFDVRTDVYALGVLLHELLVGGRPLDAALGETTDPGEWRRVIREVEPPRPSVRVAADPERETIAGRRGTDAATLVRMLERDLDWIVMKALEKDRRRRYASVEELQADLDRYGRMEPILAAPPTRFYRAQKFARRHRGALVTTTLIAVSILLGLAGSIGFGLRAMQETERAEAATLAARRSRDVLIETLRTAALPGDANAVRPPGARIGRAVSIVDALETTRAVVTERYADDPAGGAELLLLVGTLLAELGEYEAARDAIERAIESSPDPALTMRALTELGHAFTVAMEPDQAEVHLQRARELAGDLEHPASGDLDRLEEVRGLRMLTARTRDPSLPIEPIRAHYESMLVGAESDGDPVRAATCHWALGILRFLEGDGEGALASMDTARRTLERGGAIADALLITLTADAGTIRSAMGRRPEAVESHRALLGRVVGVLGPDHLQTAAVRTNLADALTGIGPSEEAVELLDEALRIRRLHLDDGHFDVAQTRNKLGFALAQKGRRAEARPHFRAARPVYERVLGPDHGLTAYLLMNLSQAHYFDGEYEEAAIHAGDAFEARERGLGPVAATLRAGQQAILAAHRAGRTDDELAGWIERALALCERPELSTGSEPAMRAIEVLVRLGRDEPDRALAALERTVARAEAEDWPVDPWREARSDVLAGRLESAEATLMTLAGP